MLTKTRNFFICSFLSNHLKGKMKTDLLQSQELLLFRRLNMFAKKPIKTEWNEKSKNICGIEKSCVALYELQKKACRNHPSLNKFSCAWADRGCLERMSPLEIWAKKTEKFFGILSLFQQNNGEILKSFLNSPQIDYSIIELLTVKRIETLYTSASNLCAAAHYVVFCEKLAILPGDFFKIL